MVRSSVINAIGHIQGMRLCNMPFLKVMVTESYITLEPLSIIIQKTLLGNHLVFQVNKL